MLVIDLLLCFLFTLLILVALSGNVLVCVAVFVDRKLRSQPENLYLVSLSVSDLLVSVLVMIFAAANDLLGYWPFGDAYCKVWICFDISCCTASILNLCAIAFDRYSSKRLICTAIGVVWLLSLLVGLAQVIVGVASENEEELIDAGALPTLPYTNDLVHRPTCHLRLSPMYAIFSSIVSFYLPATVMVFLYSKLYFYARMHVRSIRTQLKQATSLLVIMQLASNRLREVVATHAGVEYQDVTCNGNADVHSSPGMTSNNTTSNNNNNSVRVPLAVAEEDSQGNVEAALFPDIPDMTATKKPQSTSAGRSMSDQKARLTLGIIMGTFLLCWLPFFIINPWRALVPDFFPQWVFQTVTWLGYFNSMLNPIIYGIFNRDFKKAFRKVMVKLFYCYEDARKHSVFFGGAGYTQGETHHRYSG